jgi:hypothetical protein
MDMTGRFERQLGVFGQEGQDKIAAARIVVVGVGGLGSHVVQQLALLGNQHITVIDAEELADSNRNRYVTARFDDSVPGTRKVDIAERLAKSIDPSIHVEKIYDSVVSPAAFAAITEADFVIAGVDSEGARLVLNELCAAYARPYIDLASDVPPGPPLEFGGRIATMRWRSDGCLVCRGLIDLEEAGLDLAGPDAKRDRAAIYGIPIDALGRSGPSVVSINGVVASLGVTELMAAITGLRDPKDVIMYRGHLGKMTILTDPPQADCYYCGFARGKRAAADVERYLRANVGTFLR